MKTTLEPTGERLIEAAYVTDRASFAIYVMHAASYAFAERRLSGLRVLDLGCGSGYGAARLAAVAAAVTGVDVAADAIAFARNAYERENLAFETITADGPLPFADQSFDAIVSFQVIEHVGDDHAYLSEARRVLVPGGLLIIATPDRRHRLFPGQRPWNRWHLREYSCAQLTSLIGRNFEVVEALRMGAPWDLARIEIGRYRWTRLLTLPFTFPGAPERWRRWGLDALHSLRRRRGRVRAGEAIATPDFGFDEHDIEFSPEVRHSLNIVVVARRHAS
jgi:SAM-dependent methyltransferase